MNSSKLALRWRMPFAAVAASLALFIWAMPASAQAHQCGTCEGTPEEHQFTESTPFGAFKCDNAGGCHVNAWFNGSCHGMHGQCNVTAQQEEAVESALDQADSRALVEVLAVSDNWVYESDTQALSFTCSDRIVARYVLPQELADLWSTAGEASAQAYRHLPRGSKSGQ